MLSLLIQRLAVNCLGCELTSLCPSPFPCLQSAVVCLPQPGTCLSQSAPHTVIKILSLPLHKRLIFCIVFSCFGSIDTVAIRVFFWELYWVGQGQTLKGDTFFFFSQKTWPDLQRKIQLKPRGQTLEQLYECQLGSNNEKSSWVPSTETAVLVRGVCLSSLDYTKAKLRCNA